MMLRPPTGSENSVLPHFALQHPVTFRRVVKRNFSQKDDTILETITVGQTLSVGVNGWVGVVQASSGLPPPSDQGRFQEAVIVIGLKRVTVPNWAPPLENFVAIEPESLKLAVETLELWWSFKTYYSTIRHK